MKIKVRVALLKELQKQGVKSTMVNEHIRYSRDDGFAAIDLSKLTDDECRKLADVCKANAGSDTTATGSARKVASYLTIKAGPMDRPVGSCEALDMALRALISELPNKWLFKEQDGQWYPYFVKSVNYRERDRDTPARTVVTLMSANRHGAQSKEVHWEYGDLRGQKTVDEILADRGYLCETEELCSNYAKEMVRYNDIYPKTGEQFAAVGYASPNRWTRRAMEVDGIPSKVVMDDMMKDEDDNQQRTPTTYPAPTGFWESYSRGNTSVDEDESDEGEVPAVLPMHPILSVFRLSDHEFYDIHVNDLRDYVWNTALADKLVLAEEKKALVDLLVTSAGEMMEDIIEGKTGGVIVAASGPPGTGKTLTAEVYSESTKRPLYTVQCSQLGTDEESIEKKLKVVLDRAARWKAILLIDEADVYIRTRGEDIHQNAIVGVFLRTLERYRGVLFMTTNRATIIDDAILSRLTAHVRYEMPDAGERERIWKVLASNYNVRMSIQSITTIAEAHELSGRDIKNLLKLAGFYLKRNAGPLTPDLVAKLLKFQDSAKEVTLAVGTHGLRAPKT